MNKTPRKNQPKRPSDQLEALWDDLLSRKASLVRAAYQSLEPEERNRIYTHLERMARETGWQPEQRRSARVALRAIDELRTEGK